MAPAGNCEARKPLQGNKKRHRLVPQLLIRGFGVRVPGGAPVLTWAFFCFGWTLAVFSGPWETKGRPSVPVASPCRAVRGTMAAVRSAASRARRGETLV